MARVAAAQGQELSPPSPAQAAYCFVLGVFATAQSQGIYVWFSAMGEVVLSMYCHITGCNTVLSGSSRDHQETMEDEI